MITNYTVTNEVRQSNKVFCCPIIPFFFACFDKTKKYHPLSVHLRLRLRLRLRLSPFVRRCLPLLSPYPMPILCVELGQKSTPDFDKPCWDYLGMLAKVQWIQGWVSAQTQVVRGGRNETRCKSTPCICHFRIITLFDKKSYQQTLNIR